MSLEDKMFLRFQKERVKKARNVSLFNLDGGENVLTHKGEWLLVLILLVELGLNMCPFMCA